MFYRIVDGWILRLRNCEMLGRVLVIKGNKCKKLPCCQRNKRKVESRPLIGGKILTHFCGGGKHIFAAFDSVS